jgi:hypothetical protein
MPQSIFSADNKETSRSKQAQEAEKKQFGDIKKKDLDRDNKTKTKSLPQDRTVYRYTTKDKAKIEAKKGVAPESHLTTKGGPGRPLSAAEAKRRYGLEKSPDVRETVELKKGDKVRSNRVIGGERGRGELKTTEVEKVKKILNLR